jgi:UDP-glucose 4-epimerase
MPGVHVGVSERRLGCATCTRGVCFVDAIHILGGRAVITDACRGCGRCVEVCRQGAIEITIEGEGFVAETIARIAPLVDVT